MAALFSTQILPPYASTIVGAIDNPIPIPVKGNMTKLTTRTSTSTRLTDTQLIVLSRAAQREDGAANLPEGITDSGWARKGIALSIAVGLWSTMLS